MWRSLVSRLVRVQEASGSNPDTPTKKPVTALAVTGFLIGVMGFERPLRKHAGGMFLGRGRIPRFRDTAGTAAERNRSEREQIQHNKSTISCHKLLYYNTKGNSHITNAIYGAGP